MSSPSIDKSATIQSPQPLVATAADQSSAVTTISAMTQPSANSVASRPPQDPPDSLSRDILRVEKNSEDNIMLATEYSIKEHPKHDQSKHGDKYTSQQRVEELTARLKGEMDENCRLRANIQAEENRNMDLEYALSRAKQDLMEYKSAIAMFQKDIAKLA